MNGVKVLISPLSWGFGHAGRMIPLALELRRRNCEVIFAADSQLVQMAEKELPGITVMEMPGFRIRYSRFLPQYICIFLQLTAIVISAFRDHRVLRRIAKQISPGVIISDNRFGFYHKEIFSVYVTHQVRIPFPSGLRFMEPLAGRIHRLIISRYDLCLVPDYPGDINLSGRLSHPVKRLAGQDRPCGIPAGLAYMGPLSRFALPDTGPTEESAPASAPYVCLVLSGPEPQRTLLLEKVLEALPATPVIVLSATPVHGNPRPVPAAQYITSPGTATMRRVIKDAALVIARAGYTSVMEIASLNRGAVLIPTPGQPEQEYLGRYLNSRYGFVTLEQNSLKPLASMADNSIRQSAGNGDDAGPWQNLPDPVPFFENAINLLTEQKKK